MSKQTAENGYIAAALREHRMVHDPATGAARCECGWTGPYTRLPGSDMADHLARVVSEVLSRTERTA